MTVPGLIKDGTITPALRPSPVLVQPLSWIPDEASHLGRGNVGPTPFQILPALLQRLDEPRRASVHPFRLQSPPVRTLSATITATTLSPRRRKKRPYSLTPPPGT